MSRKPAKAAVAPPSPAEGGAIIGTIDTTRCMKSRWGFYHGGVLLLVYMDLMVICMILFLLLYPYMLWISATH